jgi:hypothetical protein
MDRLRAQVAWFPAISRYFLSGLGLAQTAKPVAER